MRVKHPLAKSARRDVQRILSEALESRTLLAGNPSVNTVTPAANATGIALNATVQATVNLPNGGVDPNTVTSSAVYLYQTAFPNNNSKYVPADVKTSGAGDAIILSPSQNLLPSTSYTFVVTTGLKDTNGDSFTAFSEKFTTGNTVPAVSQNYAFTQTALPTTAGIAFTDVQMGPDGDLWASTEDGRILRYGINADGTLATPITYSGIRTLNGGNQLISGFTFDPSFVANPSAPKIWVSNTFYALSGATNAPNYTGKLTVMSGSDLSTVTDALTNLPRSVSDHVNDQPIFQPGTTNLFFCQAGENAYGAPDTTWGNRSETLLTAAILEVNTAALNLSGPPVNMLTTDVGGTYNPYAAGAPVTIYATGIRNAFDLLFDDKGQLWAAANGSSSGGNSPSNGSTVPALTNIQQVEQDSMFKVVQGAYYGHPDPARGQYVLDDGNPTTGGIPGLAFTAYPSGTNPDPSYQIPNYTFGLHSSPDGIIEYTGSAFGGALSGKFLVAEYSAPDDIVVLSRDSGNNIVGGYVSTATSPAPDRSVSGFQHLNGPVSLVENPATGQVYVSELTGNKITLLTPSSVKAQINTNKTSVAFNAIAAGHTGAAASRTETVTITNTGANPLTFSSISVVNDPSATAAATNFTITNAGSLPTALNSVGTTMTIQITYSATVVGLQSALLQIKSNDTTTPTLNINLHGIGTAGQFGSNEPSLVQILRAHNIPTIVGAGPNDVNINTVAYPLTPDASSQEVSLQEMVAASSGPVLITAIASFSASASPVSQIGYYTPGNSATATSLFTIAQADAQTVDPAQVGAVSFNPGSTPFGLYALFPGVTTPNGAADYHYSEDALNTSLDANNPRKIRFFPYETANGTVVPNTYVFAVEDYNDPTYNSFVNFVGIISNVTGAPPKPTNFAEASQTTTTATLTWTASAGATSYVVQREDPGSSTFVTVASALTSPTFTDSNLAAGATYTYQVQAVNSLGSSLFSAPLQITQGQNPTLAAPTNLHVTSATGAGVALTWTASANATGYIVERLSPGASTFAQIATGITATSYTDANVIDGQSYQYEVLAENASTTSAPSAAVSATIPAATATLTVNVGKGANKAVQFATDTGTVVLIKYTGLGAATINFNATTISQALGKIGDIVSGTDISIAGITVGGSILNSALTITTKGGGNSVSLGSISVNGSIGAISAATASLVSSLSIDGSVNKIALGSALGATIDVGGVLGMLKVPSVSGISITSGGAIRTINSTTWTSTQPISAPSIGTITIAGAAQLNVAAGALHTLHVKGALHDSTFNLSGSGIVDLATLTAGAVSNTTINSLGNIGSITASSLTNSHIYAGTGTSGSAAFPPVAGGFPASAIISAVHLKKIAGAISLTNSSIAAARINTLALGSVLFDNGGTPFGVEAVVIGSLGATDSSTGKAFTITHLASAAIVTADLAAKGITPHDFDIDVL